MNRRSKIPLDSKILEGFEFGSESDLEDDNTHCELIDSPIENWPNFAITWDLKPINFHYCHYPISKEEFDLRYPEGLRLAKVPLSEFDENLIPSMKQTKSEFWDIGDKTKKAKCISEWSAGNALTPPKVDLFQDGISIAGNHRVAVARVKGEKEIFILVEPVDAEKIENLFSCLEWVSEI